MRIHHSIFAAAALFAGLHAVPVAAESARERLQPRNTGVGQLIAEQGNCALRQIRVDLRDALHRPSPTGRDGRSASPVLSGAMVSPAFSQSEAGA